MLAIKLISMRYEATSLLVYKVNWKFHSEAGHEANDACYDASHETDFEACRVLSRVFSRYVGAEHAAE